MATDESKIIVKLEAEVGKLTTELSAASKKIDRFEKTSTKTAKQVRASFSAMSAAVKVAIGAIALREAAQLSDTYTEINSRLKLVTGSTQELAKAQEGVFSIAQDTRQAFSATAELYQRLAQSSDELRGNQDRLLKVTDVINKAIAAGGTSAESAQAAIVQLGQGLSAGALRGEEFNSVVEQTPRLAQALADGLGVGIGQLRQMAQQGQLTSDIVIRALENQAQAIESDFNKVGATIGQAFTVLQNTFVKVIGGAGEASGAQRELTGAIIDFANALNDPKISNGANTILTGVVVAFKTAFEWAAKAGSSIQGFAEAIAAWQFGPAIDDVDRINESISGLETQLENLKAGLEKSSDDDFSIVERLLGAPERIRNDFKESIAVTEEELKKLYAMRDAYSDLAQPKLTQAPTDTGSTPAPGKVAPISLPAPTPKIPKEVESQYDKLLANLREQVALYNETSKAAEVRYMIESGALGKLTEQQQQNLLAQAEMLDQMEKSADLAKEVEALRTESLTEEQRAVVDLQEKYKTLADAIQAGQLSPEEGSNIAAGLANQFEETSNKAKETTGEISEFAAQAARNMQGAFADFLFNPFEDGIKGMGERFGQIIQRMIAEAMSAQIMNALFGASFGQTGSVGGYVGQLGTAFAGFFAEGGTIPGGKGAIVGENGPEFIIPASNTRVVPNHELQSVGGTTVNVNVQGVKDSGDLKRTANQIARQTSRAIKQAG